MSRDVCGICWCPYDDDGKCGCKPVKVIDPAADEALLRQALEALETAPLDHNSIKSRFFERRHHAIAALRERLGEKT